MINSLLVPLDVPQEGLGHGGDGFGFLEPLLGFGSVLVLLVALTAGLLLLRQRGLLPVLRFPQGWLSVRPSGPEESAKQILAERFARGELSSEDFLDRASALNWTPGVEAHRRLGQK